MTGPLLGIDWRALPNAPAPGTRLGVLEDFLPGEIREFCFPGAAANAAFRLLVYRHGDDLLGYLNQCPHHWLPMNRDDGTFLKWSAHEIMCRHHSAVFDLVNAGSCRMGPCQGSNLVPVPLAVVAGCVEVDAPGTREATPAD